MLENVINSLLLGNTKLSGLRTIIINSLVMILAAWDFLDKDGGIFDILCSSFGFLCNISQGQFYLVIVMLITAINNILRWLTVAPVGVQSSPAQLMIAHDAPDGKQKFANWVVYVSIGLILVLIVKIFI